MQGSRPHNHARPYHEPRCCNHHEHNIHCPEPAIEGREYCFWHDREADKTGPDIKEHLEQLAREGRSLCGFQLTGARLDGLRLQKGAGRKGADLRGCCLKRASLKNAHLYRADLTGASLLKADLSGANLNGACFEGASLLGVTLKDARTEHIRWGNKLWQEKEYARLKRRHAPAEKIREICEETEETCRHLRRQCENSGLSRDAGRFFYREMRFRRLTMPLFSLRRFLSRITDSLCGYGEKPVRLIIFSLLFIVLCAAGYFFTGINDEGVLRGYFSGNTLPQHLLQFAECLYFSVVTFTTLGYGDITPVHAGRLLAAIEAFTGSFSIALYVVVFVRRMAH